MKLRFRYEDRDDENSRKILQFLDENQRPPFWRDVPLDHFALPDETPPIPDTKGGECTTEE